MSDTTQKQTLDLEWKKYCGWYVLRVDGGSFITRHVLKKKEYVLEFFPDHSARQGSRNSTSHRASIVYNGNEMDLHMSEYASEVLTYGPDIKASKGLPEELKNSLERILRKLEESRSMSV